MDEGRKKRSGGEWKWAKAGGDLKGRRKEVKGRRGGDVGARKEGEET